MTSTSVVLGIATLGTPEVDPDCDCATDATGSIAMRKGIMNFIGSPLDSVWYRSASLERVLTVLFHGQKNLLFSETLYEKVPRLHQHLLTPLGGQGHPDRQSAPQPYWGTTA